MIFVNKMDVLGADFFHVLDTIHDRLRANAVPVQMPIGAENQFVGIIDLITMKAEVYDRDVLGTEFDIVDIPEDMLEEAQVWHDKLVESTRNS